MGKKDEKATIDRIRKLIQRYQMLPKEEKDYDEIINDKQKIENLFEIIGKLLSEFDNLQSFRRQTKMKAMNIDYKDLKEQYKELIGKYQETLDIAIDNEFEEMSTTLIHYPTSKQGSAYSWVLKELDSGTDLSKSSRIDMLESDINEVKGKTKLLISNIDSAIEIFDKIYYINPERPQQEVQNKQETKELTAIPEQKGFWERFFDKIARTFGKSSENESDAQKIENDLNSEQNEYEQKSQNGTIKYWELKPNPVNLKNEREREKWNKRLEGYIDKINKKKFSVEDMPEFILDYSSADFRYDEKNKNWITLKEKLDEIKGIIAEYYECSEDEIFLGDYFGKNDETIVPYKVIFGNANFHLRKIEIGSKLQYIIGNLESTTWCEMAEPLNIRIIYGNADFDTEKLKKITNLIYVGKNLDITCAYLETVSGIKEVGGNIWIFICDSLIDVDIENVNGAEVFFGSCNSLRNVNIENVNGKVIFDSCNSLRNVNIGNVRGEIKFYDCKNNDLFKTYIKDKDDGGESIHFSLSNKPIEKQKSDAKRKEKSDNRSEKNENKSGKSSGFRDGLKARTKCFMKKEIVTRDNLDRLQEEMKSIVGNEEIIKQITDYLEDAIKRKEEQSIMRGNLKGQKYIAFKNFKPHQGYLCGDVIIIMNNHCYCIFDSKDSQYLTYDELLYDEENGVWNQSTICDFEDDFNIYYSDFEKEKTWLLRYVKNYNKWNPKEIMISYKKGNSVYGFFYNSVEEFIKGMQPTQITIENDIKTGDYFSYVKRDDEEKYDFYNHTSNFIYKDRIEEPIESNCSSYQDIICSIADKLETQNISKSKPLVDSCPKEFVDAIKREFNAIPKNVLQIANNINPELINKMGIKEVTER